MADPLEALRKATSIGAGPAEQRKASQREFGENHPILQGLANLFTGGATDPDFEPGPADLLMAGAPLAGGIKGVTSGMRNVISSNRGLIKPPPSEGFEPIRKVVLDELFSSNPAAREAYEKAMLSQMEQVRAERAAAGAQRYNQNADLHDVLLDLEVGRPRPIPTETGFETAIPLKTQGRPISAQPPTIGPSRPMGLSSQTPSGFESKYSGTLAKEAAARPRLVKKPKSE